MKHKTLFQEQLANLGLLDDNEYPAQDIQFEATTQNLNQVTNVLDNFIQMVQKRRTIRTKATFVIIGFFLVAMLTRLHVAADVFMIPQYLFACVLCIFCLYIGSEQWFISTNFKQQLNVGIPRAVYIYCYLSGLPPEQQLSRTLDVHRWICRDFPEILSFVVPSLISTINALDRNGYFSLPLAHRRYIFHVLREHSAFMVRSNGEDGPANGSPNSPFDESIALAVIQLYMRVQDTAYRDYLQTLKYTYFGANLDSANKIKSLANDAYEVLKQAASRNKDDLLTPSINPTDISGLLTPAKVDVDATTDLLRPSQENIPSRHQ